MTAAWQYQYSPNLKQLEMHQAWQADEILFGGAGGPGKTDAVLAAGVTQCLAVPNCKVLLIRRTHSELEDEIIPRLQMRLPPEIARWNGSQKRFRFRNGSIFRLGYLEREDHMYRYIGAEYVLIIWDELTQQLRKPYIFLRTRLRMAGQVAADMRRLGLKPRYLCTTNPGGRGHGWVKDMFVEPLEQRTGIPIAAQWGKPFYDKSDRKTRIYIPAKATDNPDLDIEAYMEQLNSLDPEMAAAIRDGDWNVLAGARFSVFRRGVHVIEPEELPVPIIGVPLAVGVDYGSQAPFCALWGARFPSGLIVVYRELYRTGLTPHEQASLIRSSERTGERIPGRPLPIALDPSTWTRDASQLVRSASPDEPPKGSIAWYYREIFGSSVIRARNERVAGWALVSDHLRIRPADLLIPTAMPRLLIYSTCTNLIRTLPALQRDDKYPEEVADHQEDHAPDALRYLLMQFAAGAGHDRTSPAGPEYPAAVTAALADATRWR